MEVNEIKSLLEDIKGKVNDSNEAVKKEVNEKLATLNDSLKGFSKQSDIEEVKAMMKGLQDHTDKLDIKMQDFGKASNVEKKSFQDVYSKAVEERYDEIKRVGKGHKVMIELKDFTLSGSLTGDAVATYNQRQILTPAAKINARDLIPTTVSATGLYVQYKEGALTGAVAAQTEGVAKAELTPTLSEVKVVNEYIAGFTQFSKQSVASLPWIQQTLSRILLREFYKSENAIFNTAFATGTGSTTSSSTVDCDQLIDWVANLEAANYSASMIVIHPRDWATLAKTASLNVQVVLAYNPISKMFELNGIPIVKAAWATIDKAIVMDVEYIERVEVEGLKLEFFEQDSDNIQKNLITARIECLEKINIMDTAAIVYGDFGNVS